MRAWNKAWGARIEEERRKREPRAGAQVGEKKVEDGGVDAAGSGDGAHGGSSEVMVGRPGES